MKYIFQSLSFVTSTFMRNLIFTFGIVVIVFSIYVINLLQLVPLITSQLFFVFLFALVIYVYFAENAKSIVLSAQIAALLLTGTIISLVASTGWFGSPFSFTLYLLIVTLTLFFPAITSMIFAMSILCIAVLTLQEGDFTNKFLTILSLLATIPVSLYLRGAFLQLKQSEKTILILQKSHHQYRNHVEEILDNVVHHFATDLRTEIGISRQIASKMGRQKETEKRKEEQRKLNDSIDRSLMILSHFEEEATGSKLVSKPHSIESDEQIHQLIRDSL
jgi:hypothetical protein